jgi:hypothetical protein
MAMAEHMCIQILMVAIFTNNYHPNYVSECVQSCWAYVSIGQKCNELYFRAFVVFVCHLYKNIETTASSNMNTHSARHPTLVITRTAAVISASRSCRSCRIAEEEIIGNYSTTVEV